MLSTICETKEFFDILLWDLINDPNVHICYAGENHDLCGTYIIQYEFIVLSIQQENIFIENNEYPFQYKITIPHKNDMDDVVLQQLYNKISADFKDVMIMPIDYYFSRCITFFFKYSMSTALFKIKYLPLSEENIGLIR